MYWLPLLCSYTACLESKTNLDTADKSDSTAKIPEGANPGECSDGADNDYDGDYDCNDEDCSGSPDCNENFSAGDCSDGADNDQDGLYDCNDPDCESDLACTPEIDCSNDLDDDEDGFADCEDPDCSENEACVDTYEGDEPNECSDGIDNDSDGWTDCNDPDCEGAPDCEEALNSFCKSLYFDGVDDFIEIEHHNDLNLDNDYTELGCTTTARKRHFSKADASSDGYFFNLIPWTMKQGSMVCWVRFRGADAVHSQNNLIHLAVVGNLRTTQPPYDQRLSSIYDSYASSTSVSNMFVGTNSLNQDGFEGLFHSCSTVQHFSLHQRQPSDAYRWCNQRIVDFFRRR